MVFSACNQIVQESVNFSFTSDTGLSKEDGVREYAVQLLSIGLFYLEYRDAIKEGDGERVLRCWKFLLPLFFNSRRTNYSKEAILLLYQHQYLFTPRQAKQLLYSRLINTQGLKGKNIERASGPKHCLPSHRGSSGYNTYFQVSLCNPDSQ